MSKAHSSASMKRSMYSRMVRRMYLRSSVEVSERASS